MQDKLFNITVALAGMVQAAALVGELAQTGKADESAFETSIYSIFQIDAEDVVSVYQDLRGIELGLEKLINTFSGRFRHNQFLIRYVISLIQLQNKLQYSSTMHQQLQQGLDRIKKQTEYFSLTHATVIANLADIYLTIIRTFGFRLTVWGNQRALQTVDVMEKIRAVLLAGIRSAVLWKQMGGSRLQLLCSRKKIKITAEKILSQF